MFRNGELFNADARYGPKPARGREGPGGNAPILKLKSCPSNKKILLMIFLKLKPLALYRYEWMRRIFQISCTCFA